MSIYEWDLYEIPIEKLGLSVKTINALKRAGLTSVGDCVDCFGRMSDGIGHPNVDFRRAMDDEVKPKLVVWLLAAEKTI